MAEIYGWLDIVAPLINGRNNKRNAEPTASIDPDEYGKLIPFERPCRALVVVDQQNPQNDYFQFENAEQARPCDSRFRDD